MHARDEVDPFASDRDRLWRAAQLACDRSAIQRAIKRDKELRLRGVFVIASASARTARPPARAAAAVVPTLEQTIGRAATEPAGLASIAAPCGRTR